MTSSLQILVDVPDSRREGFRRVTLLAENSRELIVATMREGSLLGEPELRFELSEANQLARLALAGDARALTRPGLARTLAATVAVLFRVAFASGALIIDDEEKNDGGTGHLDDQPEAGRDEGAGD